MRAWEIKDWQNKKLRRACWKPKKEESVMFELSETKKDCTWQQAMSWASSLGEGWRLPTKEELQIIQGSPRAKEFAMRGRFWSSSTYVYYTGYAWIVDFGIGDVNYVYKTDSYYARCVRGSFDDLTIWCFGKSLDKKEKQDVKKSCDGCVSQTEEGCFTVVCAQCTHPDKDRADHFKPRLPAKTKDLTWMEAKEAWEDGWQVIDISSVIRYFAEGDSFNTYEITKSKYQLTGTRRQV